MAVRGIQDLQRAIIKTYKVKNGVTIVANTYVRFGTTDDEVDNVSGADDDGAFGVALGGGTGNASGSVLIQVVLMAGGAVALVTVAAAGATRGAPQKVAASGFTTDAPANGGGTVSHPITGIAMQTGVSGDLIGVLLQRSRGVSAT